MPEPHESPASSAQPADVALPTPSEELLRQALTLLDGERRPTISYLQRHLRLGYRAALGLRQALEELGHVEVQCIMKAKTQGDPSP